MGQCSTSVQDALVVIDCLEEALECYRKRSSPGLGGGYWIGGPQHYVFDILGTGGNWGELDPSGHEQETEEAGAEGMC